MQKRTKMMSLVLLVGVVLLCTVGCSGTNQGNKGGEKVVTVAIAGDNGISTMDATYCMTDIMHYELIYEPLVVFGENGEIEPGLATEWTISDDGLEYTFKLRPANKSQ